MALSKLKHAICGLNIIKRLSIQNHIHTGCKVCSLMCEHRHQTTINYNVRYNRNNLERCTLQPRNRAFSSTSPSQHQTDIILSSPLPDLEIPDSTLLLDWVTKDWWQFGDKTALIDSHTQASITYNELRDKFTRFGSALARRGFKKGDVATLDLPNCIEFAIVYYGAMSIGMIVSAINPAYTADELMHALNLSETRLLIVSPTNVDAGRRALPSCPTVKLAVCVGGSEGFQPLSTLLEDDGKALPDSLDVDARNDVTTLPFSSGTTGLPKGVMLTSYNLVANCMQMSSPQMLNMERDDRYLCVVPMFHAFGQNVILLLATQLGATTALMSAFDPVSYLDNIEKYKPTYLHLAPPMLVFLAKHPLVPKYDFSSARYGFFGAAPAAPSIISEAKEKMRNDLPLCQGYGLTEASPGLTFNPTYNVRSETVGVPIPNTRIKIRDIKTNELLGPNEEGEICGYGPQIMKGYWKNEAATNETIVDGWLHTGDIGFYDKEGYITVTDRLKELIKYKAYQVAPAELEDLLLTHPSVQDSAVIGKPDEMAGELPRAYVVLKPGATATQEDIEQFVKEKAAPQKHLRGGVEFRAEIPRSASGKILRRILKDELTGAKK